MSLQQLLIIFWARKNLVIAYLLVTMITTLIVSLMMTKQYTANTALVLDQQGINPITGREMPIQLITSYMATQTDIIKSPAVALAVVDILGLDKDKDLHAAFQKDNSGGKFRDWVASGLMKRLDVVPSRESSILGITFSDQDPETAAKIANAYAQAYIQTANELKRQPAQQIADWFDEQLKTLKDRVEKAGKKLANFQLSQGVVAPSNERIGLEDAKLAELSDQLTKSQLQTEELVTKKKQLTAVLAGAESSEALREVLSDPLLQQLKANLAQSEAKFAELSIKVDRNHPQYRQALAEISNLKKQVRAQTNTILHGFNDSILASKQRDESLTKAVAEQKHNVLKLKELYDEIAVLNREVVNAQLAYDTTMQRSIQTRMESEIRQSNIAVLDEAVPPKVVDKPKIKLNMILSVLLGSVLGFGAALFAEILDRRVRSPMDIIDALDLPVFGVISAPAPSSKKSFSFLGAGS